MSLRRISWRIAEAINRAGFSVFSRLTVVGKENVPLHGSLLVVCNHLRMADIPLLAAALPRKLVFVGKQELWKTAFFRNLGNWYDCFPVDRTTVDLKSLRQSLQVLREEGALVIFPEGSRSRDGVLQPGHPGAALIALRSHARVLPVAITGTDKAGGGAWLWRRPRLSVNIGSPFLLDGADRGKEELSRHTATIMQSIAALLPEDRRGGTKCE
ncbi:MAG: 1-acyl-sn-glycerol-3-phosphate acyltransferase [Chloroflexi bacterium]|nr:1-acyl-sn-glycerol-3-phosphate acyltransferase [Chloroflexota bacterium]